MTIGWTSKALGDVLTLQRGFDLPTHSRILGSSPLVSSSGIIDTHNEGPISGPGVVTGRSGSIGNVFFIDEAFWPLNTTLFVSDFKGNDPRFIYYLLEGLDLRRFAGGTGVPTLNRNDVHVERALVTDSIAEQQRIVAILDDSFAGIATAKANAEKNLQNARALFETHLQSVFGRRRDGWNDQPLASLCSEITVGHVGPMKTEYKPSGVPFLRSQNIRPFEVSMENVMFVDETFHGALRKSRLRPGDLAIVRTGYPGTAAVIPPSLPDANCSDLVIVRPGGGISPHFLAAFFNSAFGKQMVLGKLVGAAQKHFNVTAAKEVILHVPSLPEQLEIVRMIDLIRVQTQRLESICQRKLATLDALKQSLLHQAFSGAL